MQVCVCVYVTNENTNSYLEHPVGHCITHAGLEFGLQASEVGAGDEVVLLVEHEVLQQAVIVHDDGIDAAVVGFEIKLAIVAKHFHSKVSECEKRVRERERENRPERERQQDEEKFEGKNGKRDERWKR